MKFCRAILILAVFIIACLVAILAINYPWPAFLVAVVAVAATAKKGYQSLTAFGTARLANEADLEKAGMLSGRPGLILGRILVQRPSFAKGLKALFSRRITAITACEMFVRSMRKLQPSSESKEVRASNAVHTAIFAPTGVGKGVSCIIPFLLDCPDSIVVVDFKGENALITAEHRAREFGHKIVILDPFGVVTQ
jgi:type IV secretion system protein VirD4